MAEKEGQTILSVEALRRKLQYTIATRVEEETGVSYQTLMRIRSGKAKSIRTDTARKLTEFFDNL